MADAPCAITGISPRQRKAVQASWAKVQPTWMASSGQEMFVRMFSDSPAIKSFFKMFDGQSLAEIKESPKLRAHICNFQHAFSSFVDHLDDPECLILLLNKFAENHKARAINPDYFIQAFKIFVGLVKEVTNADDATVTAWQHTLAVVQKIIADKMATL